MSIQTCQLYNGRADSLTNRYDEAETAATIALMRDPQLFKARFRRAVARKNLGNYRGALLGLSSYLRHRPRPYLDNEYTDLHDFTKAYPDYSEAEEMMGDILQRHPECRATTFSVDDKESMKPSSNDRPEGSATPVPSDSEDYGHHGDKMPCRDYNDGDCSRGVRCKHMHAPDNHSVRDKL